MPAHAEHAPADAAHTVDEGASLPTPELPPRGTATSKLRIEIDRELHGGFLHGRHDLWIRGQVISKEPIEQVALRVGRHIVGRIGYGRVDGGARITGPDGMGAKQYAFSFSLGRPAAEAASACVFAIIAEGDSESVTESFIVAPDQEGGPSRCIVRRGPVRVSADDPGAPAPTMLYVERVTADQGGQLLVRGWALSLAPIVTIQVFAGDTRIGVAQLGRSRADVAEAYPVYPNAATAGFVFASRLDKSMRRPTHLRIEAVALNGTTHEAICPLVPTEEFEPSEPPLAPLPSPPQGDVDPRRRIEMFRDEVVLGDDGKLVVSGWALSAVGIARVEVRLDGELVGEAELALPRPDVADTYRTIPMARYSGFRFARQVAESAAGTHEVKITAVNGLDDVHHEAVVVQVTAARSPVLSSGKYAVGTPFRLEVDMPKVVDGTVKHSVSGMLTIQGWSLASTKITEVEVFIDGKPQGNAHYGLSRPDVAETFPEREDALRTGFVSLCSLRGLENGPHIVQLKASSDNGDSTTLDFRIDVQTDKSATRYAQIRDILPPLHTRLYTKLLNQVVSRAHFSLLLCPYAGTEPAALSATLQSLAAQVCQDWRLHVFHLNNAASGMLQDMLASRFAAIADRVEFLDADADFIAPLDERLLCGFLSPGDELGCDALAEVALFAARHPQAEIVYADESRVSPVTGVREAFFKPGWSPDLLLSTNYIGRPWFVTAKLLAKCKISWDQLATEGEYGLLLRCTERARSIQRLARLICRRGREALDSPEQERAALEAAARRRGIAAELLPGCTNGTWRLRRRVTGGALVSIIIPTCAAHGHIKRCIETLRSRTTYRPYEIICIDNIPESEPGWKSWVAENADKVVHIPGAFNWSRFNNLAVLQADGDYLLFLNDDIEIIQDDWLDAMMEHAARPEVGVVGPQLLYPDHKVQHAGMFLSTLGTGRHAFRMLAHDDPGYFGLALTQRNVVAVTGACMLVQRDKFASLGGFDEAHGIINNDLDYCLRAHEKGDLIVFTPHASLIHHELSSRDRMEDTFDRSRFAERWKDTFVAGDPYFNPRLSLNADDYRPDDEPAEEIFVGHPMFSRDDIRQILAIKLDHIGDFLTALPAMRRLKEVFPHAELHVLASPAMRSVAEMEPAIDGFIDFQFFHTRSELGPRDLTENDFHTLKERLIPYQFDLAIDLRLHPDTRKVMHYVPARLRAGYDRFGEFPFLDIALEWEGDSPLQRKRAHISDRLLHLVETIATACAPVQGNGVAFTGDSMELLARLPARVRQLFRKPVVAVHPGVGNTARQWPPEHYAALCDLLVATSGVNVVLIGGPDERKLAESVLRQVAHRRAVVSLAGKTSLKDLPKLLKACALYVGNNSGPKHLAASLGVPTIGIHSGVVDAVEWGPLGERAMALQRNMQCKPCYLLTADHCPRDMACMKQLTPAIVHQSCEKMLSAFPPPRAGRRRESRGSIPPSRRQAAR
jgi:ADP-heptose:LPS heptosyltransferase/GT2 family glycosyltransferase